MRVVIADDNRDLADSLGILLKMDGCDVIVVNDGASALAAVEAGSPRVVLLDIGMPALNGYEVARRIRKQGRAGVTLIAITGWGQTSDKAMAMDAGFDYHFTKPVEPDELTELLRSLQTR